MLDACYSCGFEAVTTTSDFEKLNNAIVRAASRGGEFAALNGRWQDEVVEERSWKIAIPPVWSALLERFWIEYGKLYRTATNRAALVNPYDVAPAGISGALRDLYAPTVQATQQTAAKVEQTLKDAQAAATAKVKNALRSAGRIAAEGAAEETKDQATNWGAWAAGAAAILVGGYLAMRGGRGAFAGLEGVDDDCNIRPARYAKGKIAVNCKSDQSFKSRGQRLADVLSGGKYTGRENAYLLSPGQVELFRKAYDAGWDASSISGELRDPSGVKRSKAEARKLLRG